MAVREPKSRHITTIDVVGRDGAKRGTLELTSGNITFSRRHGEETMRLTYQQLIELFEKEIAYQKVDIDRRMPKGRVDGHDFTIEAFDYDEVERIDLFHASCALARMLPKRQSAGGYDIDFGLAKGRQKQNRFWHAFISVQAVLKILDYYIDRLVQTTDRKGRDGDVVITRPELRAVLLRFLKKLDY